MLDLSVFSEKVAVTLVLRATPVPVGVVAFSVGAVLPTTTVAGCESTETSPAASVAFAL